MNTSRLKEAATGIKPAEKNELAQKLLTIYSERQAIVNQINAAQWNSQGARAAEFAQLLAAVVPEAASQYQTRQNQTVHPFPPAYQIAARISVFGRRVPSDYNELFEYSQIEDPQSQETYKNAEAIAKACEIFAQTTRHTIKLAHQADDPVTAQVLTAQLQTAEQLATQLKRFE